MNIDSKICVIGGGFYGSVIALYLNKVKGYRHVDLYEKEADFLTRASYVNQARVHSGYHYPRSFTTAYRSRANFFKFCSEWDSCIKSDFAKYYALAKRNSKVTSQQFQRFCNQIGAPVKKADKEIKNLFSKTLIQDVFEVQEYAFNAKKIRNWVNLNIHQSSINANLSTEVIKVEYFKEGVINVMSRGSDGILNRTDYSAVLNCTYSGISQIDKDSKKMPMKHEISELALIDPPREISGLGITMRDGPFFSCMPFPSMECHSLWHVRYSPHKYWLDNGNLSSYQILKTATIKTRIDRMIRDATRYINSMKNVNYRSSLYEIKTVLQKNENDDGRPILFRESVSVPGMYSVLGGKIDNIYDILFCLDQKFNPLNNE